MPSPPAPSRDLGPGPVSEAEPNVPAACAAAPAGLLAMESDGAPEVADAGRSPAICARRAFEPGVGRCVAAVAGAEVVAGRAAIDDGATAAAALDGPGWTAGRAGPCGSAAAAGSWLEGVVPGPVGPAGPPGPQGPQGPQSPSLRVVRNNCLSGECTASCRGDEVLVSAYCGPSHNPATFLDERQASCGIEVTSANAPLVAVCLQAPQ